MWDPYSNVWHGITSHGKDDSISVIRVWVLLGLNILRTNMEVYATRERVNSLDRQSSVDEGSTCSINRQSSTEDDGSDQGVYNVSTFWVQWQNPERVRRARSLDQNQNNSKQRSRHSEPHLPTASQRQATESKRLSAPEVLQEKPKSQAEKVQQVTTRLYQVIVTLIFQKKSAKHISLWILGLMPQIKITILH